VRGTRIIQEEFALSGAGTVFTKPYLDGSGGYDWNRLARHLSDSAGCGRR
jgi:hypothetical protein